MGKRARRYPGPGRAVELHYQLGTVRCGLRRAGFCRRALLEGGGLLTAR